MSQQRREVCFARLINPLSARDPYDPRSTTLAAGGANQTVNEVRMPSFAFKALRRCFTHSELEGSHLRSLLLDDDTHL